MHGEIKHLYRHHAFLYSRLMTDNGGIFVCRLRHIALAGNSTNKVVYQHILFCNFILIGFSLFIT